MLAMDMLPPQSLIRENKNGHTIRSTPPKVLHYILSKTISPNGDAAPRDRAGDPSEGIGGRVALEFAAASHENRRAPSSTRR
jgi:hypothetical protein